MNNKIDPADSHLAGLFNDVALVLRHSKNQVRKGKDVVFSSGTIPTGVIADHQ
ncbi:hypothetical protein [Evansella clarkii]|uniref:hypothetical protein n=1 Tax=Evansella clarkii TaxID=79879 RepID=UPI001430179D|nr:hypothetical protein [Evansella clarkii]